MIKVANSVNTNKNNDAILATVLGTAITATDLPVDLYIPPEALRVFLEAFTGPLDLLLYLIRKQNIDILDIPVAKVTAQYMEYLELMQELKLELAAEYLLMAAILAEIKSKLLLPHFATPDEEGVEEDPRTELIRRLQEYERYKKGAENLDNLPRIDRDIFHPSLEIPETKVERQLPHIELQDLLWALKDILQRAAAYNHHKIRLESLSVREKMSYILERLQQIGSTPINFADIFIVHEGKLGVVVSFIAILELLRQEVITITQYEPFGSIYLKSALV
jgi:segregation and condensation protein A